jgi:ABC-2 type transport system ATP-binding protein
MMLELRGLSRRYARTVALDDLSLDVPEGELVGFVGPNGAGKTTAMRIALGVLEPDAGDVHWRGQPITRDQQRLFGYMPEERGLYPKMRVDRHLRYLAELHGLCRAEASSATALWLDRLEIAEHAQQRIEELSLGNQQRVQLAAALVHDPPVLILDEPFSGLDPTGTDVMTEVLRGKARRGAAVIFSSHQLDLVERICDRVAIVNRGAIVAAGRIDELHAQRSRPRLRVDVEGATNGWADDIAGVTVVARDVDGVLLELSDGVDDQRVLGAASRAGRVRRFVPARPTLAELFREVVER